MQGGTERLNRIPKLYQKETAQVVAGVEAFCPG